MKDLHTDKEQDLRAQLDLVTTKNNDGGEWRSRHDDLERENQELQQDNQELQQELLEQQRVTDEVRREAAGFLEEMKTISDSSDKSWEREEGLVGQVRRLEEEVKEWKGRYSRTKTQLRSTETGSTNLSVQQPSIGKDRSLLQSSGLIRDYHITNFQLAIDEVLRVAHSGESRAALDQVKSVVIAVKDICEDVSKDSNEQPMKMRARVTATASNFITGTKNFAYSGGVSPVSLLDAAASHLSAAVVDLVHTVKMRPTSINELDNDDDDIAAQIDDIGNYYNGMNDRASVTESVYSSNTIPPPSQKYQLPSTQYQMPLNTRKPVPNGLPNGVRNGLPNGKPSNHTPGSSYDQKQHEEELRELREFKVRPSSHLYPLSLSLYFLPPSLQSLANSPSSSSSTTKQQP